VPQGYLWSENVSAQLKAHLVWNWRKPKTSTIGNVVRLATMAFNGECVWHLIPATHYLHKLFVLAVCILIDFYRIVVAFAFLSTPKYRWRLGQSIFIKDNHLNNKFVDHATNRFHEINASIFVFIYIQIQLWQWTNIQNMILFLFLQNHSFHVVFSARPVNPVTII
jgi:hypothetical protein